MSSITIGNYTNKNGWEVISDTGTSFIGAPKEIADAIAKAAGANYDSKYDAYLIDCKAKIPDLVLKIAGSVFYLTQFLHLTLFRFFGKGRILLKV